MSEVYVAVRLGDRSGRTFVIKRPPLSERASGQKAQAIEREGEVLAAVASASLPALEARGDIAGLPYVAIEHVRGASLEDLAQGSDPFSPEEARAVALDLAKALVSLHNAGFVHGDVSSSNVVVDDAGEAKLVDLGLARRVGEARADVSGTAGYLAPEAALPGVSNASSDVYGWAVVIAECALGRRVFPEEDLASAASRGEPPRELRAWEEHVPGLIAALSRDPAARPASEAIVKGLEVMSLGRDRLSQRVIEKRRELESGAKSAPTKAAPMPKVAAKEPPPSPIEEGLSIKNQASKTWVSPLVVTKALVETAPSAPGQTARRERPLSRLALVVLVVLMFGAGQISARLMLRSRLGSVSYAGAIPARSTLEIDGQKAAIPLDGRLTLPAGDHTLALVTQKGVRREFTFRLHPNEHVVLLPMKKGAANKDDDTEDREP